VKGEEQKEYGGNEQECGKESDVIEMSKYESGLLEVWRDKIGTRTHKEEFTQ
jgi:hypothetical protein